MYKCSLQAPVLLLCLCLCLGEPQNRQRNNRNNRNNSRRPAARQNTFLRNGVTRNGSRDRRGTEVYPGCDGKVCLPEAILCADRQQKVGGLFWIRVISSGLVQCHQRIALTHHFTTHSKFWTIWILSVMLAHTQIYKPGWAGQGQDTGRVWHSSVQRNVQKRCADHRLCRCVESIMMMVAARALSAG